MGLKWKSSSPSQSAAKQALADLECSKGDQGNSDLMIEVCDGRGCLAGPSERNLTYNAKLLKTMDSPHGPLRFNAAWQNYKSNTAYGMYKTYPLPLHLIHWKEGILEVKPDFAITHATATESFPSPPPQTNVYLLYV